MVTILTAKPGMVMTKTFSDEGVRNYSQAKYFHQKSVEVGNLRELSKVLTKLETKPLSCVIRGQFLGLAKAKQIEGAVDGDYCARLKALYDDKPLPWVMIDVDNYEPKSGIDPVLDPVNAALDYIQRVLPEEFHDVSFHWQLSASAGQPSAKGKLKAHLWFWLETPYDSVQMTAWAKSVSPLIDVAPLRTVQVHYTANPIFEGSVTDPVPVRSGLYGGVLGDVVPLVIDESVLKSAYERYAGEDLTYEFKDPSEKPGVIGAFHRAYSVERVINELLPEEFSFDGDPDQRRVTWLNGGGSPGGCFITDDRLHFGSTHNTDPFDNRVVNLFDLVRHYKFGELDEGMDPFELLTISDRPSHHAMVDWCLKDKDVQAELTIEDQLQQVAYSEVRDNLSALITEAETEEALRGTVRTSILEQVHNLEKVDIEMLARTFKTRLSAVTSQPVSIEAVRSLLRPPRVATAERRLPRWADKLVFVTHRRAIYNYEKGLFMDQKTVEFLYNPVAGVDENGFQMSAYALLRDNPATPRVDKCLYMPSREPLFEFSGSETVNLYRPSSVPNSRDEMVWTEDDHMAVYRARRHIEILCGERKEVTNAFLDWLAFNVQNPGVKMSYNWLLWGGEGTGKTWIGAMMASIMGEENVKVVAASDVLHPTFNGWAEGACLSVIEEVRIHGHKKDAWDQLKEPLSNERLSITRKGIDPYVAPNVTNYLIFSNHCDAAPLTLGSRRVAVIAIPFKGDQTASQLEDMASLEGFSSARAYFDCLFGILQEHHEALRGWLLGRKLGADFNPKGRAPFTDELEDMARAGVSDEEELVREVVQKGVPFVSSEVINVSALQHAIELWEDGGRHIETSHLLSILSKMGFKKYSKRVKFNGTPMRVWIKDIEVPDDEKAANMFVRSLLEKSQAVKDSRDEDDFL